MKLLLAVLFSALAVQISFGQNIEENWYRDIKGYDEYNTRYDFKFYTRDDVTKAKQRFALINQSPPKDEWEGVYTSNTELGTSKLHWSSNGGFVDYYFYHTLTKLNFGIALNQPDSVKLVSQSSQLRKRKSLLSNNLIKVKVGAQHFLVPENRLQDFVDRAVGRHTNRSDFGYYRQKVDELENKLYGLPVLPEKYKRFLRRPVETRIVKIGSRKIYRITLDDGTVNNAEVYRFVELGAGKDKRVKAGMNFFVEDLGEWVEITKVLPRSSIGKIRRNFDENKQEECFNGEGGSGNTIPCRKAKVGMRAKTQISL